MNRRQFTSTLALSIAAAAVPDLAAQKPRRRKIMAELDPSKGQPHTPLEAARINKETLQKLGYTFRTT